MRGRDRNVVGSYPNSWTLNLEPCTQGLIARQAPGYAIGGLSGGEDKRSFVQVVAQCTARLPQGKPRYVMGVGYDPILHAATSKAL